MNPAADDALVDETRTTPSVAEAMRGRSRATWFGHPRGLTILFMTETWEKFSFFGMRALQVYYMTKALHLSQVEASLIFGLYGGGVYFTPIFGGIISDRWLGRRNSVVIGGLLMAIGHFMMTQPALFYGAMVMIALGNGLYLPSLPSQVQSLYAEDDPRRSGAFNVYYAGVNLGGLLAPLICGTLGELYGWDYGFGAAGVGMCLGLLIYLLGGRYLPRDSRPARVPRNAAAKRPPFVALPRLLFIGLAVIIFRSAYEQTGNSLALWADTDMSRDFLGLTIPVTWFQSLNPLFIFILTPFFVVMWRRAAARHRELSSIRKMVLGAAGVAASYLLLAVVSAVSNNMGEQAHWMWLVLFFLTFTAAELYILPIGLGLFARLAPRGFEATTIAAWFLAAFGGNLLAGVVGGLWSSYSPPVFFCQMAGIALLSGGLIFCAEKLTVDSEAAP